ncbi:MerR family transcriptional regulator [Actinomadura sp. 21ATH]|uniref:MerR family transcriptional regulator n=1 Tax=Actinomadura sp. 21ATH TaxID=1735444 RepID=UPI0035C184C6
MRNEEAAAERLRPIDLARIAGVSAQQIRNYADSGVLPPAPRTPAGYRRFGAAHRHALLTYRALARGYGWPAAREIMQAVHAGDVPAALALVDAAHAGLHEQRLALEATREALEAVAGSEPEPAPSSRSVLRIGEAAARLGVRTSALRVWEAAGLITPRRDPVTGYRGFGPADVRDAQMISMLRAGRYPLAQIRPILDDLRRAGSTGALREAVARRRDALNGQARAMLEGAGLLHGYLAEEAPGPAPAAGGADA